MGQVTTEPTFISATALVPKARNNTLKILNLKGGMFKNTQTEAVLGTCHPTEKFFGLHSHLTPHPVHLIKLVLHVRLISVTSEGKALPAHAVKALTSAG
jgi:hypothetical protein